MRPPAVDEARLGQAGFKIRQNNASRRSDVDCTRPGRARGQRFGIEGRRRSNRSRRLEASGGENYDGDRSYEALDEFAATLGPSCSAISQEHCNETQLAELQALMATPREELVVVLSALKAQLETANTEHEELIADLEKQYEDSEAKVSALKAELAPRMKLLRAATATATSENEDKDEM